MIKIIGDDPPVGGVVVEDWFETDGPCYRPGCDSDRVMVRLWQDNTNWSFDECKCLKCGAAWWIEATPGF